MWYNNYRKKRKEMKIMKMTELAKLLIMTAEEYGDKEVVLTEEGTGEVSHVVGLSFNPNGEDVMLEHLGWDDYTLAQKWDELERNGITDAEIAME